MKFDKVLLRRYYDTGVKKGVLVPHKQNDYIFENVYGDRARTILNNLVNSADSIPVHGNRRPVVVGVIADGEIMGIDEIRDYMQSYGVYKIEFSKNKRISVKSKDGSVMLENINEILKNKYNYDYIDEFLDVTKTKYVKSKESILCKNAEGKKEFKKLILKAEVRLQVIKEEYLEVFPPTPDQEDI